jgi:hypothetical protein
MINEKLKLTGRLDISVFDNTGVLKDSRIVDNLVVTSGLTHIVNRIASNTPTVMSHMAVGTGTTAPSAGQTALVTESVRVALASATPGSTNVVYVANFPAGTATAALTEAGIFNAASAGTMMCRTAFAVINKGELDTMAITWTVTLAAV